MREGFLRRVLQLVAAVAVAVPSLVCAQQQQSATSASPGRDEVAARVGDRTITVAELDEAWRRSDASAHAQATQAVYDGRRRALDRLVADMLIEQAAKAKGLSPEQFTREEVARRTKPVADAAVDTFYAQNVARMQGKSIEEMRPAIRSFLEEQQDAGARAALIADLRKGGPAVHVALDPPRQPITVAATDPSRGGADAAVVLVEYSDYQ